MVTNMAVERCTYCPPKITVSSTPIKMMQSARRRSFLGLAQRRTSYSQHISHFCSLGISNPAAYCIRYRYQDEPLLLSASSLDEDWMAIQTIGSLDGILMTRLANDLLVQLIKSLNVVVDVNATGIKIIFVCPFAMYSLTASLVWGSKPGLGAYL